MVVFKAAYAPIPEQNRHFRRTSPQEDWLGQLVFRLDVRGVEVRFRRDLMILIALMCAKRKSD